MTGTELIARVRVLLRDEQSSTHKGEFWTDEEILLALNASQDLVLNFCLANKWTDILGGLITESAFISYAANVVSHLPGYVHYISGVVGDTVETVRMARFYIGAEGYVYQHVKHDAAMIIGDTINFLKVGVDTYGIIWYYKYPALIIAGTFNDDFPKEIYHDVIARKASVILSIKETQTQRDFKNDKRSLREIVSFIPDMARYIIDYDLTIAPPQPQPTQGGIA